MFNRFAAPSVSGLFTLGWMCPVKREQARCEWKSELLSLDTIVEIGRKIDHEINIFN